jgi:histidinol dehydrogenase
VKVARFADIQSARSALLARRSLDEAPVSESVLVRIGEVFGERLRPTEVVERILRDVRHEGDDAVRRYTRAFDGRDLCELRLSRDEIDRGASHVSPTVFAALRAAADEIRAFHERARRTSWIEATAGGTTGQLIRPLERVGIYAPGGRVPYPSTVLMAAIPARVAGVSEIVLCSPGGPTNEVAPALLAAAKIAEIDAIYRVGGAQAIGAMAYGTASIPRVDKIVGPGNLFVALAKRMVYGHVGIDGLAGPTECVIVADDSANPRYLAADFLAQAEHDPSAQPIIISTCPDVLERMRAEAEGMLATAPRAEVIRESIATQGALVVAESIDDAIELANDFAPEHLCLCVRDAWSYLGRVRHAGGVFVGEMAAEAIGDYTAGPSHIMPTGGTARFGSPLNLDDFLKITSIFGMGEGDVRRLGPPAIELARAEGLHAHAEAIAVRLTDVAEDPA